MSTAFSQILRRLQSLGPRPRRGFEIRQVDSLETRIMPTAVVAFTGTSMTITGDTTSNIISVTRVGNQVHVDANGGLITVAGTDVPSFDFNLNGAFNLTAKFQGADDSLVLTGPLQLKSASINMGDAITADTVVMTDATLTGKLTITTGTGNDLVDLIGVSVTGATAIDTGWSNDTLVIQDCSFTGATTIKTDIGVDTVVLSGLLSRTKFVGKLTLTTGDDSDIVVGTKLDSKAFSIDTGDGGDIITMADWLVNGGMSVKTGSGFDIVTAVQITQSGTSSNLLDLGSDTDVATLALCGLSGPTTINLGSGVGNVLSIDDVVFNNTFTLNSQGTTDVIAVEQNVGLAGATTFAKAAKFNFGLNDVLLLSVTNAASSTKFLSTVAFTGKIPNSTVVLGTNTSFAIAPTVKNVLVV